MPYYCVDFELSGHVEVEAENEDGSHCKGVYEAGQSNPDGGIEVLEP